MIDAEDYLVACMRYIELNPVRAGMVSHPRDYAWSSYRAHADGERDDLLTDHKLYRRLGRDAASRQAAYRQLCRGALGEARLAAIRDATNQGWALGNDRFHRQIEVLGSRRATPRKPGRPPNEGADELSGNLFLDAGARAIACVLAGNVILVAGRLTRFPLSAMERGLCLQSLEAPARMPQELSSPNGSLPVAMTGGRGGAHAG